MLSVTISSGTPPNVSNASSRNEKSISCVLESETLYTLNLEYESNRTKMFTSIVSPEERMNGIDSFQSNCACLPIGVSYLTVTLLIFDGLLFLKYESNSGYFLR